MVSVLSCQAKTGREGIMAEEDYLTRLFSGCVQNMYRAVIENLFLMESYKGSQRYVVF